MEREKKQEYLRQEIVDQNYDPNEFTEFCGERKGTDIDLWSFEELVECVKEFKHSREERKTPKSNEENSEPEELEPPEQTETEHPEDTETQEGIYSVSTNSAIENNLSLEEDLEVAVKTPEVIGSGLFSSGKVCFTVFTAPFEWSVKRLIEDFLWLRTTLQTQYPGFYVPPAPPKRFRNSIAIENQNKQLVFLQRFLSAIVRNHIFRRSSFLVGFLKENSSKNFQAIKKEANKLKKPDSVNQMFTINGTAICDPVINVQEDQKITDYLNSTEVLKKKLKRQTDTLIEKLSEVSDLFGGISETYKNLEDLQSKLPEIPGNKPLYCALKESFAEWAASEYQKLNLVRNYCNAFSKYGYLEVSPLLDLVKEKDSKLAQYRKSKQKLLQKKEKLWQVGNVQQWGLRMEDLNISESEILKDKQLAFSKMLYKDNRVLKRIEDEFAYLNFQVRSECRRVMLDNQLIENIHFTELGNKLKDHTQYLHQHWENFISKLTQIKSEMIPSRTL